MLQNKIIEHIRNVPDFPKAGILFKDITPVLLKPDLCREITIEMANQLKGNKPDMIAGIESRGFLFGMMLAQELQIPFITIRKAGKLPYKTIAEEYALEYGTAKIEMHIDVVKNGNKVLIHDDLLATGGTAAAAARLILKQGGIVAGFSFLVELAFLNGNKNLNDFNAPIYNLVSY